MTNMIELKHHHGGISVPDLDASIDWFARVPGFEVEKRFDIENPSRQRSR